MLREIEKIIDEYSMIGNSGAVTVAVSGGADSVALLHAMLAISEKRGFKVYAAHLNHCLRGAESDGDERFVRDLCESWNVELTVEKIDVPEIAAKTCRGTEETAREERYAFLQRAARGKIATAHTADDNAETLLFRLARGTGLDGLCGIPPVRGNIIRPLLYCTRAAVERYCDENGLAYRNDSTNSDIRYSRNRIRHTVMPGLKAVNPGCAESISRAAFILREDAEFLNGLARQKYSEALCAKGVSLEILRDLPEALLSRVLRMYITEKTGIAVGYERIRAVETVVRGGGKAQISGGIFAESAGGYLCVYSPGGGGSVLDLGGDPELFRCPGLEFVRGMPNSKKINKFVFKNSIDCDKIVGNLRARHREPGDKYRPVFRRGTREINKLFSDAGLSPEERHGRLILEDGAGIVWVEGFGVDVRVACGDTTKAYVTVISEKFGEIEQ